MFLLALLGPTNGAFYRWISNILNKDADCRIICHVEWKAKHEALSSVGNIVHFMFHGGLERRKDPRVRELHEKVLKGGWGQLHTWNCGMECTVAEDKPSSEDLGCEDSIGQPCVLSYFCWCGWHACWETQKDSSSRCWVCWVPCDRVKVWPSAVGDPT